MSDEKCEEYYAPPPDSLAGRVCQSIRERIGEVTHPSHRVTQLVIGTLQAEALYEHMEITDDAPDSLEDWFGMEQVIVVPGPQIYPVPPDDYDE